MLMPQSPAFRAGVREAIGVPIAVLGPGFVGYGALAADSGYSLGVTVFSALAIWALPGQLALSELYAGGASAGLILFTVMLTGARFLPMTMVLVPVLRDPAAHSWRYFLAAQLIAMTTWAVSMRRCPDFPAAQRLDYFVGFSLVCWIASATAAGVGFMLDAAVSPEVRIGLVFLTPIYFVVILVGDARNILSLVPLACGAVAGPLFYLLDPQWSLPLAGLVGGTVAYLIQRQLRGRHA